MPIFKGKQKDVHVEGEGLVLFETVQDAMKAEKVIKDGGYTVKMVAPPAELRKGCDLAVQINLVEQAGIDRLLRQQQAAFVQIVPIKSGTSALLDIVKITDFGIARMEDPSRPEQLRARPSRTWLPHRCTSPALS